MDEAGNSCAVLLCHHFPFLVEDKLHQIPVFLHLIPQPLSVIAVELDVAIKGLHFGGAVEGIIAILRFIIHQQIASVVILEWGGHAVFRIDCKTVAWVILIEFLHSFCNASGAVACPVIEQFLGIAGVLHLFQLVQRVIYDLPPARTGTRGRPKVHGDKLTLEKFELFEVQNSDYSVGYRRVLTRLFGKKPALAIVTKPTSGQTKRLFLCSNATGNFHFDLEFLPQPSRSFALTNAMRMPISVYSIRWNIEVTFYQQKTFWTWETTCCVVILELRDF